MRSLQISLGNLWLNSYHNQKSTGVALGSPHPHRTCLDVASNMLIRIFFFFLVAPIQAKTNRYGRQNKPEWATGRHSSASCGLVREEKKKEKEEGDEKTQRNG